MGKKTKLYDPSNPFHFHQVKVARSTLKMPDAMVGVMGGPGKKESLNILKRFGLKK